MNKYELITIIAEKTTEKELPKISKKIKKIIQEKKGKIESEESLGRKKLGYLIKKNQFGTYLVFQFTSEKDKVKSIALELNAIPEILRFMITKAIVEKAEPAAKKAIEKSKKVKKEKPKVKAEKLKEKIEIETKPVKKKAKPKITKEIESEAQRLKKLEEELGKILDKE